MTFIIAALIIAGIVLMIVEVVFIPGTTVVGLLGLIFTVAGVIFSFSHFGTETGSYILLTTAVAIAVTLYLSFRNGAWKKFSHKESITSKVNEGMTNALSAGEEGITVSALRPIGSARFQDKIFEVKSNGEYLASGIPVRIVTIRTNEILVEQII